MIQLTENEQHHLREIARLSLAELGGGYVNEINAEFVHKALRHGLVDAVQLHPIGRVRITALGNEALKQKPLSKIAELVKNAPVDAIVAAFAAGVSWRETRMNPASDSETQDAALRWARDLD